MSKNSKCSADLSTVVGTTIVGRTTATSAHIKECLHNRVGELPLYRSLLHGKSPPAPTHTRLQPIKLSFAHTSGWKRHFSSLNRQQRGVTRRVVQPFAPLDNNVEQSGRLHNRGMLNRPYREVGLRYQIARGRS